MAFSCEQTIMFTYIFMSLAQHLYVLLPVAACNMEQRGLTLTAGKIAEASLCVQTNQGLGHRTGLHSTTSSQNLQRRPLKVQCVRILILNAPKTLSTECEDVLMDVKDIYVLCCRQIY